MKSHAEDLAAAAEQAEQKKINAAQFTQQMNALRARDKQRAQAQIDQWYTRLAAVGKAHADQRARVLAAANNGGGFFGRLVGDIEQVTGRSGKGRWRGRFSMSRNGLRARCKALASFSAVCFKRRSHMLFKGECPCFVPYLQ